MRLLGSFPQAHLWQFGSLDHTYPPPARHCNSHPLPGHLPVTTNSSNLAGHLALRIRTYRLCLRASVSPLLRPRHHLSWTMRTERPHGAVSPSHRQALRSPSQLKAYALQYWWFMVHVRGFGGCHGLPAPRRPELLHLIVCRSSKMQAFKMNGYLHSPSSVGYHSPGISVEQVV